jgi:hypothetical protein
VEGLADVQGTRHEGWARGQRDQESKAARSPRFFSAVVERFIGGRRCMYDA